MSRTSTSDTSGPPSITTFPAGTTHTTARVAALFGVKPWTVWSWVKRGILKAGQVTGSNLLLIPGEEVQRVWREMGFDATAAAPPDPPSEANKRRRAEAAAKRLDRINGAKAKRKKNATR